MLLTLEKIMTLSEKKVAHMQALDKKSAEKLIKKYSVSLQEQTTKTKKFLKEGKLDSLEDGLGNILWDYLCLLNSLETNENINIEEALHKAYRKYKRKLEKNLSRDEIISIKNEESEKEKSKKEIKSKISNYLGTIWNKNK